MFMKNNKLSHGYSLLEFGFYQNIYIKMLLNANIINVIKYKYYKWHIKIKFLTGFKYLF